MRLRRRARAPEGVAPCKRELLPIVVRCESYGQTYSGGEVR